MLKTINNKSGIVLSIVLALFLVSIMSSGAMAWYDDTYGLRIPINSSAGSSQTEYDLAVNLTYNPQMQSDFSDLLCVDEDDLQTIPCWNRSQVDGQWVELFMQVNITASNDTVAYVYFKKSGASPVFNVYPYFGDNFTVDERWLYKGSQVFVNTTKQQMRITSTQTGGQSFWGSASFNNTDVGWIDPNANWSIEWAYRYQGSASNGKISRIGLQDDITTTGDSDDYSYWSTYNDDREAIFGKNSVSTQYLSDAGGTDYYLIINFTKSGETVTMYKKNLDGSLIGSATNSTADSNWNPEYFSVKLIRDLSDFWISMYNLTYLKVNTENTPAYSIGGVQGDVNPPTVTIVAPLNQTYGDANISFNVTAVDDVNASNCWFDIGDGDVFMTNTSLTDFGYVNSSVPDGTYNASFSCNDTSGNTNSSQWVVFSVDDTPPSISNLIWSTTGGFTDDTLSYGQIIAYINATTTGNTDKCSLQVIDPDSTTKVDSLMTNVSINWTYNTQFTLNKAGTWSFNVTCNDTFSNTATDGVLISVTTTNFTVVPNWFGYSQNKIMSQSDINNVTGFGFNLFEFEDNITELSTNFELMLDAINDSYTKDIRVGINYLIDYNINDSALTEQAKRNITANISELTNAPYLSTVEYISLDINNIGDYNNTQIAYVLNDLAKNITDEIQNKFVIYSKNFEGSGLDQAYIQPTTLLYVTDQNNADLITTEAYYLKNNVTLGRIYEGVPYSLLDEIRSYYEDIISALRSTPNITSSVTDDAIAVMNNGDIVVFNNGSSQTVHSVDITADTIVIGKDAWSTTDKILIARDTNGTFDLTINAYLYNMIFFDDLDHIQMDSYVQGNVFKGRGNSTSEFNYTDGSMVGNFGLYGANDFLIELFDPHYQRNNFIVYYGWINASYISIQDYCEYEIVIIADKNNQEIDNLIGNCTNTEFYGYVSVADYDENQQNSWYTNKTIEIDQWVALNSSMDLFIDGLDIGIGGANFSSRMKDVVDYAQITKGRQAILNTYTAYESFATWGTGGVMKESCVNRWNGIDASNPTSYTREDWDLELNKSLFYQSHNVRVICQAFNNRTTDGTNIVLNYTELQDIYFASKVLGYDYFYLSQPDFLYALYEYVYDVGEDLSNSWFTDDDETYYRRYSNGIVYYNSSNGRGWMDDGREVLQSEVCFYLYNAHASSVDLEFTVNRPDPSGSSEDYSIPDNWTVFTWSRQCINLTDRPVNGRYRIEGWVSPRTTPVGQGLNIGYGENSGQSIHSYYDSSTTDSFTAYPQGRNWLVNVSVTEVKKISIDTTDKITQTNVSTSLATNITISSSYDFNITIWTFPQYVDDFLNISYWNGTDKILMDYANSTTCDSNNPLFNYTTIDGNLHGACIEPSGMGYVVRVASPHLSNQTYVVDEAYDTTPPTVTINSPLNTTYVTSVTFNVTLNENGSACLVNYGYNNVSMATTDNFNYNYTNSSMLEGVFTARFYCNDTVGNMNANQTITFTMNNPPVVGVIDVPSPVDPVESSTATVDASVNVTDGDFDTGTCTLRYPNTTIKATLVATETVLSPTLTGLNCSFTLQYYEPAGSYQVSFFANDTYGNNDTNQTTFTYNSLTAYDLSTNSLNFGTLSTGQSATRTFDIENTGNAGLSSSINASNLTGTTYQIDVSSFQFDNESTFTNATTMTTSYQFLRSTDVLETGTAYIRLTIPAGTQDDTYTGTISVRTV